jgi:hypothetical protein
MGDDIKPLTAFRRLAYHRLPTLAAAPAAKDAHAATMPMDIRLALEPPDTFQPLFRQLGRPQLALQPVAAARLLRAPPVSISQPRSRTRRPRVLHHRWHDHGDASPGRT